MAVQPCHVAKRLCILRGDTPTWDARRESNSSCVRAGSNSEARWAKTCAYEPEYPHPCQYCPRDYLHRRHTRSAKTTGSCVGKDLQVRNISGSAAGSTEQPGRNVRGKAGLNQGILDLGWSKFRRQREYKRAWSGGGLIAVPPTAHESDVPVAAGAFDPRLPRVVARCGGLFPRFA